MMMGSTMSRSKAFKGERNSVIQDSLDIIQLRNILIGGFGKGKKGVRYQVSGIRCNVKFLIFNLPAGRQVLNY